MKKINFSDRYGLTEAVLSGRKTQTRRIITCPKEFKGEYVAGFYVYKRQSDNAIIQWPCMYDADERTFDGGEILPKYKIGEIVAIAQCYADLGFDSTPIIEMDDKSALMSEQTFKALREYSTTLPSGQYAGKMWKAKVGDKWYLRWYSNADRPEFIDINNREILVL